MILDRFPAGVTLYEKRFRCVLVFLKAFEDVRPLLVRHWSESKFSRSDARADDADATAGGSAMKKAARVVRKPLQHRRSRGVDGSTRAHTAHPAQSFERGAERLGTEARSTEAREWRWTGDGRVFCLVFFCFSSSCFLPVNVSPRPPRLFMRVPGPRPTAF